MAHKWIGGLLAAATMLTPIVPAYAASDTGIRAQVSERIVLAPRADRQDRRETRRDRQQSERRNDHRSDRQEHRGERSEHRDTRRDHRGNQRDTRGEHRDDHRDLTREHRRDHRDYRRNGASRDEHRGDHRDLRREHRSDHRDYRRDTQRDQRSWNRDWRSDRRYNYRSHRNSHRSTYRLGHYNAPYRDYRYRRLNIGFSIGSLFYGNRYTINDPWQYRLPQAYYPYRWVRYYDDALLVDTRRGRVVDVIYGVFW